MKNLLDDDGNVIPPPDASTDVAKLIYLLEYCRRHRFKLGPAVQVGDVVVTVHDPLLDERTAPRTETMSQDMRLVLGGDGDE